MRRPLLAPWPWVSPCGRPWLCGEGTWGTCCFVGEGGEVRINVSPELLRRQMTVMGSWTFSTTGQAECAAFVAAKGLDVGQLYTHRWTLDRAEEAYRLFDQGVGGKGVFLL